MQIEIKMPQNRSNRVFISKETTEKVPRNIFRYLELRKSVELMF